METILEIIDDIIIFRFAGNLDTETAPDAEITVNKELENEPKKMIFDLSKTDFVSSAGLRVFLATAKKLAAKGGVLKLCAANTIVKDILEISGFDTFLDVKDSLDKALKDFNSSNG